MKKVINCCAGGLLFVPLVLLVLVGISACSSSKKVTKKTVLVFPNPPEQARFQYLTKITSSMDIGESQGKFAKMVLGDEKPKAMVKPYGIAIYKGKIFVCDNYGGGMERIDLETKQFEFFQPEGMGKLRVPINCVVDTNGDLYVADAGRQQIVVFDKNGEYIRSFGEKEKFKPSDVLIMGDTVYVANLAQSKIFAYSKDSASRLLYTIPKDGDPIENLLGMPANLGKFENRIYAADFGYSTVKVYDPEGNLVDTIGKRGDSPGQFSKLKGIALDKEGNLFAVDAAFDNIQVFNQQRQLLIVIPGHFEGPGIMMMPAKVMVDYDNLKYFEKYVDPSFELKYLIFVTNQYGPDKINVYGRVEPRKK